MVQGIENTRLKAHNFALSGRLFRQHPYKLILTYSANHGTYRRPYAGESAWNKPWGSVVETPLRQLSAGFTGSVRLLAPSGLLASSGRARRTPAAGAISLGTHAIASPTSASAVTSNTPAGAISASSARRPGASERRSMDLSLLYGLYADRGSVLPDTFGVTLGARLSF